MRKLVAIVLVLTTLSILWFYQFGPLTIKAGQDRLLAATSVRNGDRVYLIAHKTGDLIEAYEVSLYRVDKSGNVFVAFLGHEEPFWWGASLCAGATQDKLEIRAFWKAVATYSISDGSYDFPAKNWTKYPSHKIDGVKVRWPIPEIIRKRN